MLANSNWKEMAGGWVFQKPSHTWKEARGDPKPRLVEKESLKKVEAILYCAKVITIKGVLKTLTTCNNSGKI